MKKLFMLFAVGLSLVAFSQDNQLKCFSYIIPAYENPQIQKEYKNGRVQYEFSNGTFYKSKLPICVSRLIFKNDGVLSAYQFVFKDKDYFADADSFKLKDSIKQIERYKNLSLDSIYYFQQSGNEIQKNNYSKYLLSVKNTLVKKFGPKATSRILEGDVWIGMSREMLKASKGDPKKINTFETAYSYQSQYIYEDSIYGTQYIYLENGKVTAIQDY